MILGGEIKKMRKKVGKKIELLQKDRRIYKFAVTSEGSYHFRWVLYAISKKDGTGYILDDDCPSRDEVRYMMSTIRRKIGHRAPFSYNELRKWIENPDIHWRRKSKGPVRVPGLIVNKFGEGCYEEWSQKHVFDK